MQNTIVLNVGNEFFELGLYETISISSNLNRKEIVKAFKDGVKKIGINITKICKEDNYLSESQIKKFKKAGYDSSNDEEDDGTLLGDGVLSFAKLYLFTVSQGNPSFKYEIAGEDYKIDIGGAGLF